MASNRTSSTPVESVPLHRLKTPLKEDECHTTYKASLEKLQGNILKAFGRRFSYNLLLTFRLEKRPEAKAFIRAFADRVTSAADQLAVRQSKPCAGFFLSANGYDFLGYSVGSFEDSFAKGMRHAGPRLGDPDSNEWDENYKRTIHAMIILADDNRDQLKKLLEQLTEQVQPIAVLGTPELGQVKVDNEGKRIEHFGFRENSSQPRFFERDLAVKPTRWDDATGPQLVLARDPLADDRDACGSYLVYRKLEQDVNAFRRAAESTGKASRTTAETDRTSAERLMGRKKDGKPLVKQTKGTRSENDFDYRDDSYGEICPFASHIRKANPRGSSPMGLEQEKSHRIVRRSITYGEGTPTETGVLFMCYQARIWEQFEFMQYRWLNDPGWPKSLPGTPAAKREEVGPDPIASAPKLNKFVRLKGGEYFFAPSISFMRNA